MITINIDGCLHAFGVLLIACAIIALVIYLLAMAGAIRLAPF